MAQSTIIHIEYALPRDATHIDIECVAVVDMIIEQCGKQVVCDTNRMQVAIEVQVDVFHWNHLRVTTTSCPTFHSKDGTQRRFAQTNDSVLTNLLKCITEANSGCRFALTSRCWTNRRHQNHA